MTVIHRETRAGLQRDRVQVIHRFENGFGASVMTGAGYTPELGVIKFDGPGSYDWDWAAPGEVGVPTKHGLMVGFDIADLPEILEIIRTAEVEGA